MSFPFVAAGRSTITVLLFLWEDPLHLSRSKSHSLSPATAVGPEEITSSVLCLQHSFSFLCFTDYTCDQVVHHRLSGNHVHCFSMQKPLMQKSVKNAPTEKRKEKRPIFLFRVFFEELMHQSFEASITFDTKSHFRSPLLILSVMMPSIR